MNNDFVSLMFHPMNRPSVDFREVGLFRVHMLEVLNFNMLLKDADADTHTPHLSDCKTPDHETASCAV